MMSINVENNDIPSDKTEEIYQMVRMNKLNIALSDTALTELDVSGMGFGVEGAKVVAQYISDNRALFSLDVGNNHIPTDKLQEIDQAVRSNRLRLICEDSNKSLLEIDLSSRYLDAKDAIVVAEYIKDSGAILSVNLLKNGIGVEQARALVIILKEHPTLKSLCGNNGDETELNMSGKMNSAEDAIMLSAEVVDSGALSSLNLSKNALLNKEAGKILGDMLKGNSILKELDVSSNYDVDPGARDGPGFVQELSDGIKDNEAILSVNLLKNDISPEQAHELVKIMQSKEKLITLCGLSGKETTLDFSAQGLGHGDAVLIANDITDMGALTSLDFGSNNLAVNMLTVAKEKAATKIQSLIRRIQAREFVVQVCNPSMHCAVCSANSWSTISPEAACGVHTGVQSYWSTIIRAPCIFLALPLSPSLSLPHTHTLAVFRAIDLQERGFASGHVWYYPEQLRLV
jgi:hypothetical protein